MATPISLVSTKRMLIDKANARIVAYVSIAAFVLVFSLVATKTLISQAAYQNRVIGKKKAAVAQLKTDYTATAQLKTAYQAFTTTPENVLGGNPDGSGPQDGNNAKIVLDALPSGYDFPGLTTSLESLLGSQGVTIDSIAGTDDEVAQSANQASVNPQAVPIPFSLSVDGDYTGVQNVVNAFEHSIRPIQIQTLTINGNKQKLTLNITAQTYYQPAKSLNINKVVVR
ncbi:MAG TPA: type 4a pilus biogenesis protein PilO [Candidatus Saccharimonadales bacterium]|nr:type 4a pilus biogenesis protein PilO [Candidatus Saccharimonadales bacterium]